MKQKEIKVRFPNLGNPEMMKILVYGDGSYNSLPNGESQGAHVVFISGNDRVAPISWKSKKIDKVTKSPLATEISAVSEAADYAYLVAQMCKEVFCLDALPLIELYTDSKSLQDNLESTKSVADPSQRVHIQSKANGEKKGNCCKMGVQQASIG